MMDIEELAKSMTDLKARLEHRMLEREVLVAALQNIELADTLDEAIEEAADALASVEDLSAEDRREKAEYARGFES